VEKWTNESTSGLIYFSLGSLVKGHTFPERQLKAFLKVFAKLPQKVLWKWETETMEGKPDNVMLIKWAPQFDILCKLAFMFSCHQCSKFQRQTEVIFCDLNSN